MTVRLVLYVAGDTPRSQSARAALAWLAGGGVEEEVDAEVVDVMEAPARAEDARILLTPTLVREAPSPTRRVVGDLGDAARVVDALGLTRATRPRTEHGP